MALAFNVVKKDFISYTENSVRGWVDITLDDTYVDLGWPIAASDLGIVKITMIVPPAISAGGTFFQWDHVNSKLLAYEADGDLGAAQVCTSADNLNDGDVIRCYFEGV